MTVNAALLRQTLAHIEAHPNEWNQSAWARRDDCGTTYCFAGWACALSGEAADFRVSGSSGVLASGTPIRGRAINLLGLDGVWLDGGDSADAALFGAYNSLDDLRRIVDELCAGAGS